jgi:FkbM family methyltransferase
MSLLKLLKAGARATLASLASRLPLGARMAIVERFTDDGTLNYHNFLAIAGRFNVTGLKVRGEYGIFQSTSDDSAVLGTYAHSGTWAAETNDLLREFFAQRGGGTYLDVGANIGLTTVPVAQNANVRCVAFEPEPTNFDNLVRNVEANCEHGNVTAIQAAVFSKKTSLEFELASGNLGDHRVRLNNEPGLLEEHTRRTINVEAVRLDDLVDSVDGALAVKIDTQGAEPFVVAGGRRILDRADLVIAEFWPYGMKRMGADAEDVIQYFEHHFDALRMSREGEPIASEIPIERAAADLRRCVDTKCGEKSCYFDVIATRDAASAGRGRR